MAEEEDKDEDDDGLSLGPATAVQLPPLEEGQVLQGEVVPLPPQLLFTPPLLPPRSHRRSTQNWNALRSCVLHGGKAADRQAKTQGQPEMCIGLRAKSTGR